MIYYDSNIFISFFKNDTNAERVSFLFEESFVKNYKVYFSTYVQLEAMFLFGNEHGKSSENISKSKLIFSNALFTSITLSHETIDVCYDLYEQYSIQHTQKDIIHVASAMQSKCEYLVTLDKEFIKSMNNIHSEDILEVVSPETLKSKLGIIF